MVDFSVYGQPMARTAPLNESMISLPSDADLAAMGMTAQQFSDLQNSIAGISGSPILSGPLDLIGGSSPYSRTINEADYLIGAPKSNKGNPTSTLRQSSNDFFVYEGQKVRLVDNKTGQVIFEGAGPADAKKASDMAAQLTSEGGRKANWDIQVGPQTLDTSMMGVPTRAEGSWMTVANENPNAPLGEIGKILGTALPIAMIPLTMGASAPLAGLGTVGNIALGAGVGAASAGLKGQNILKGGLTGGLSAAGSEFLGPLVQSVGGAGKVATLLGRAVGSGIGATAGGLATGQSLKNSLIGGGITAGTTYLGGKLFGGPQVSSSDVNLNNPGDLAYGTTGAANATNNLNAIAQSTAAQLASAGLPTTSFSVFSPTATPVGASSASTGASPIVVTGAPVSSGAAPSFAVNVPTGGTPETIVTAQRQTPVAEQPSFAVNVPTQTPAVGGPDLEETIVTAQDEGLQQAEQPGFAANTSGLLSPEIIATAQKEAALTQEEPSLAVLPPATSTPEIIATAQTETPAVKEEPSFAVTTPPISTPEIIATAQTEAPAAEDKSSFAVNVPTATPEIIATAQKEVPAAEDKSSFAVDTSGLLSPEIIATAQTEAAQQAKDNSLAVIPAATTSGEKITVTAPKDQAAVKDEAAVGGPYIPPKTEIVVTGDKGTPKLDEGSATEPFDLLDLIQDPKVREELKSGRDDGKTDLDKILNYLRLAGLGLSVFGGAGGGGGGGGGGKYSSTKNLSPTFSAKLPTPGTGGAFTVGGLGPRAPGAAGTFAARPVTDWYRYGMGRALDIPEGTDLSRATSPYAGYGPGTLGEETYRAVSGIPEEPVGMYGGGSMGYSRGSSRESFAVNGPGTGRSDDIPAVLSDGEYVIDAETVALLGDGSSKAGAKKLDEMRVKIRKAKGKNLAKGKFSVNAKRPEAYMSGGRI